MVTGVQCVMMDGYSWNLMWFVLKQLFSTRATNYTTGSATADMFGAVNIRHLIITGKVGCTGQETSLSSCPGFDPNVPTQYSSDHTQDVGVVCLCMLYLLYYIPERSFLKCSD